MAPYEALYGWKCKSSVCLEEVGERKLVGPELVQITSEKVPIIRERLKIAFSRQKSYVDLKRKHMEFSVGEYVFLKVSFMHGVMRFSKKGKLAPRYVGPFEIIDRIGEVPQYVEVSKDLTYEEQLVMIVDSQVRQFRSKVILIVKVLRQNHSSEECIWETELEMRSLYIHLFQS
eukprot:XP_015579170.1 uncharacterized protein LOC107261825 [Ricinus communis]